MDHRMVFFLLGGLNYLLSSDVGNYGALACTKVAYWALVIGYLPM